MILDNPKKRDGDSGHQRMDSSEDSTPPPPQSLAWTMWGLCAAFYLLGFFQRVAPAVMTNEWMADFGIGASDLGQLSAFYFYSYVAMQIPTGILADRLGPRRLLGAGAAVAAVGSVGFGLSSQWLWAGVGRLLVGGAVSVAFVGMLKLAAHWFAPKRFAMISGLALLAGVIGAISAGVPLRWMVDRVGWRAVMVGSGVVTAVLSAAIFWMVRDDPSQKGFRSFLPHFSSSETGRRRRGLIRDLKTVLGYRNTWLLFVVPGGMVGCVLAFSGLWGVPFLTTRYGLTVVEAAGACSLLMMAWALGGPILGGLSDRIQRRKPLYMAGAGIAWLGWVLLLYGPKLAPAWILSVMTVTGFASGAMIIGFAFVKESVPSDLAGTVSGLINMGTMMGPMILQPWIGWLLDRNNGVTVVHGQRIYDLSAFSMAFLPMIGWALIAFLLMIPTRETYCRQHD